MRRHMNGCVVAAIAVMLTVTASASARAGDRTLVATYPVATELCAKAHSSTLPPKLESKVASVIGACNTLENAFAPLVVTVDAAEAQFLSTVASQRALVAAACTKPVKEHAACESARATARTTDATALATRQAAVLAFHTGIEANRNTFWTTIAALRSK
jgi:hypothetical protein